MKTKNCLMKRFLATVLLLLAQGISHAEEPSGLPPLPGAEYENNAKHRELREVRIADLVEGSPEWVARQLILVSKKMDFVELAKYQSPIGVWAASKMTPAAMAGLTDVNIDTVMKIGDSKFEADRGYMYIVFPLADGLGGWDGGYKYFLKRDGKWIRVKSGEWQRGKFDRVPGQ